MPISSTPTTDESAKVARYGHNTMGALLGVNLNTSQPYRSTVLSPDYDSGYTVFKDLEPFNIGKEVLGSSISDEGQIFVAPQIEPGNKGCNEVLAFKYVDGKGNKTPKLNNATVRIYSPAAAGEGTEYAGLISKQDIRGGGDIDLSKSLKYYTKETKIGTLKILNTE